MSNRNAFWVALAITGLIGTAHLCAAPPPHPLREFLRGRVADQAAATSSLLGTKDWDAKRLERRGQLQAMLGLAPWPERGDLHATITGTVQRHGIIVEKLHFQSLPGLYVTANFYRPEKVEQPLPTILNLCGHAKVVQNGVSFGNKTAYQHHGAWFARNGYCCLTIDTVQLGEIEGVHHGTYREGMWWWIARGYTPAGVEAWNAIRALDYLETRSEVDRGRIGVTGRSGGGAYTWWVAALDDRPACIVPVAGITDLENHVVDNCIEGHCDCMYMVNRLGWDFALVAALAAPRPCLLANTDKDKIFPLNGVIRIHGELRRLYQALGKSDRLGLLITEGPHEDTQDLQVATFRWFNRWLRRTEEPIVMVAEKLFEPSELKVFETLPSDARNAVIHETFVPPATIPEPPTEWAAWEALRTKWLEELQRQSLASWPKEPVPLDVKVREKSVRQAAPRSIEFQSEKGLLLSIDVAEVEPDDASKPIVLHVIGEESDTYQGRQISHSSGERWAFFAPRGCGEGRWPGNAQSQRHGVRRFVLVGTTLDEGRIWDIRRAIAALREAKYTGEITLCAKGPSAGLAIYAAIFEPQVTELCLEQPTTTHRDGPILMNILRVLDLPQALAMVMPRRVRIVSGEPEKWLWTERIRALDNSGGSRLEFVD